MMKSRLSMSNDMELSEILNTDSSGAIGTNNPNPFNGMNELELSTEAETVKYHIDQFKMYVMYVALHVLMLFTHIPL